MAVNDLGDDCATPLFEAMTEAQVKLSWFDVSTNDLRSKATAALVKYIGECGENLEALGIYDNEQIGSTLDELEQNKIQINNELLEKLFGNLVSKCPNLSVLRAGKIGLGASLDDGLGHASTLLSRTEPSKPMTILDLRGNKPPNEEAKKEVESKKREGVKLLLTTGDINESDGEGLDTRSMFFFHYGERMFVKGDEGWKH